MAKADSERPSWRRRYVVYAVLLGFVLLLTGLVTFVLWFKPAPREVVLSGPSAEMGGQYGRALRFRTKMITQVYLDRILCQNEPKLIQARRAKALECLQYWAPAYTNELHALAKTTGLEAGALAYGNAFLDLGNVKAGCRSAVISSSNLFLHAHNLDWDSLGGLARWTTCIIRRKPSAGRFQTVSIGFPGMIGSMDIINEKGLALSFNQLGYGKEPVKEPVLILIRRIAETCASLEQARKEILGASPSMPFIITVSDYSARTAAVFEHAKGKVSERPAAHGWVAACNTAQGPKADVTQLDARLRQSPVGSVSELQKILAAPEVLMGCNLYSVVFDFAGNQLLIASGEIPAAVGEYRKYKLF